MNIKTFSLLVVLTLTESYLCVAKICQTAEPCAVAFKSRGCYTDSMGDRVLPNYIYNERDPTTNNYGNRNIDWYHWEKYLAEFACRCATKAKEQGYDLFSVQFYGECWAGHSSTHNYQRLGSSEKCVGDFYKKCGSLDRYCSGEQETNFVYQIIDNTCSLKFEKIGCYRDDHNTGERPLANYVLNDRDSTATGSYSGQLIDWRNYDVYLPDFACRCAKKAQENGSTYFGLQYYGECWTHPQGDRTYGRDGITDVSCIDGCYQKCSERPGEICTGEQFRNYVYRIQSADETSCDVPIESIGCYTENTNNRVLDTELLNTNPASELFFGEMPVNGQWSSFFPKFLCECAREAKIKRWPYFGVSSFGNCYSAAVSENYKNHGSATTCGEGSTSSTCAAGSMLCSGANAQTNYVYKITLPSSASNKRSYVPDDKTFQRMLKDLNLGF